MISNKEKINEINELLNRYLRDYEEFFNSLDFIDFEEIKKFRNCHPIFLMPNFILTINPYIIYSFFKCKRLYDEIINRFELLEEHVEKHNNQIAIKKINEFDNLCGSVEGKDLDIQQKDAIVRNYYNQLVIAGAGSGKTTTIIGKVKYLISANLAHPNEILVLSFTNASTEELKKRIKKEINCDIETYTFHKLGLEIIKKSTGKENHIYNKDLAVFIKEKLLEFIKIPSYLEMLIEFCTSKRYLHKTEFDFNTEKEYRDFLRNNPPTTLKKEVVKSYGEMEIANFLFSNNVNYYYESDYKYIDNTKQQVQYRPDFYLPDYNIYIEYFGIDENGNVPSYFKSKREKSAKEVYNESIEWKRNIHKQNGTTMIEIYAYHKKENIHLELLKQQLVSKNVILNPRSYQEIWSKIQQNNYGIVNEISRTFETIINLIKSNNYSYETIEKMAKCSFNPAYNLLTLSLIQPIYDSYNDLLSSNGQIDFNDMINLATYYVKNSDYTHKYKYVIVDEYQDISKARYNLLLALRRKKAYQLFCVGDDWQSIYRFAGSDINLIIDFDKYWGKTYINKIETTYRFSKQLANISSDFIMKNEKQINKNITGYISSTFPLGIIGGYSEEKTLIFLEEQLLTFENNSRVFFIGRYSFDIEIIKARHNFQVKYNNVTDTIDIIFNRNRTLKITFITAHKSKGLQADYVIILNNKKLGLGFPCKIIDIPIIDLLLENSDSYPNAEERRLFYVAITRAKKKTLLLTISQNESVFIQELFDRYDKKILVERYKCPKCGGNLKFKNGPYGNFLGCDQYPNCNYTRNVQ